MQPDDQTPYVLGKEAAEKGWLPPKGISTLPKRIRKKVPVRLQFWKMTGKAALDARAELMEFEELGFEGVKKAAMPFVLQHHAWRGPIVIRFGESSEHWDLRIREAPDKFWHLVLEEDPLDSPEGVSGYEKEMSGKPVETPKGKRLDAMEIKPGERVDLKPGTEANPTKETPAWLETLDAGNCETMDEGNGWRKIRFDGKKLKGAWFFRQEEGNNFWLMSQSGGPKVSKAAFPPETADLHISLLTEMICSKCRGMAAADAIICPHCNAELPERVAKSWDVPILKRNDEKRVCMAPALIPWPFVDSQGDWLTEAEVEDACRRFMVKGARIREEHSHDRPEVRVTQNWLSPVPLTFELPDGEVTYPRGTWFMETYYPPEEEATWQKVKKGELTGYSIGGFGKRRAEKREGGIHDLREYKPEGRVKVGADWSAVRS